MEGKIYLCPAIVNWIERTYHRRRRQCGLGKLTPNRVLDHLQPDRTRGLTPPPREATEAGAIPLL